jgi:hypothetical protein
VATTPEGRTKARIKRLLDAKGVYYEMPVPTGFGKSGLDFTCSRLRHVFSQPMWESFFIEAKAHGEDPTPRQWLTINQHRDAGRKVFIIDDEHDSLRPKYDSLKVLDAWLDSL